MAMTIHCDIVSAEQEIFSGLVEMLVASAELAERKWLPADDSADASYIAIYPPKVAMITLADKNYPVVVIIDSAAIASTQKILFDTLWKLL